MSDDSHGPHAVGLNYHRLIEYARQVGIEELWVLDRSTETRNTGGRLTAAREVPGRWWELEFWRRLEENK